MVFRALDMFGAVSMGLVMFKEVWFVNMGLQVLIGVSSGLQGFTMVDRWL